MARVFRTAIWMACFLCAGSAFAAGGSCNSIPVPSGVRSCFYISASGADTNSGTSEATPWLHSPGMKNCSNTCAGVTPAGGLGFIYRGGDTWHFGNSSASLYAGVVTNCDFNHGESAGLCLASEHGSSGNPIYYGVDPAWFSGASWSRPVLTADNPLTPNPGTFGAFVSSCTYQLGANNKLVSFESSSWIIFDNFELTGLCSQILNGAGGDNYLVESGATNNIYEHVYMHGWTHIRFSCSGGSGYCFNLRAIQGNITGLDQHFQIVVDGSDSDPAGLELIYNGGYNVSQSVFRYTAQAIPNGVHTWHDNLFEHWYAPGDLVAHGNLWEENGEAAGTNAVYNNVFRNVCDANNCPVGLVGIWPEPSVGTTEYWFNNLIYDQNSGGNYFDVGQNSNFGNQGRLVIFNNIFEQPVSGQPVLSCSSSGFAFPFTAVNNHYIVDGGSPYGSSCSGQGNFVTELAMTHATATTRGYTSSQTYAYSPTSSTSPTAGVGTNEQAYCAALSAAGLSDAATACRLDTGYACVYILTNHTVSCPARTAAPRPAGGWDIGAYQYSSSQSSAPNPPTGLTASVQ